METIIFLFIYLAFATLFVSWFYKKLKELTEQERDKQ